MMIWPQYIIKTLRIFPAALSEYLPKVIFMEPSSTRVPRNHNPSSTETGRPLITWRPSGYLKFLLSHTQRCLSSPTTLSNTQRHPRQPRDMPRAPISRWWTRRPSDPSQMKEVRRNLLLKLNYMPHQLWSLVSPILSSCWSIVPFRDVAWSKSRLKTTPTVSTAPAGSWWQKLTRIAFRSRKGFRKTLAPSTGCLRSSMATDPMERWYHSRLLRSFRRLWILWCKPSATNIQTRYKRHIRQNPRKK